MAAAPSRLGPYEILGSLGAGGMGQVYRARDPRFRREVAIKVLPDDFAQDPERLKRFEHEARAAGALNHPNILTVHDLGTDHGTPYLVTELLEGETLRERLSRGPIPLGKALDWTTQIARGLAAAHEQGIVHRDLKPENLFVTRDGRAKILDFGLARLGVGRAAPIGTTLTMTEAGVTLGTVGYMAPEQVRGEPADARSDLFSFGCVLYELLSGARAFPGEVAVQVMSAILSEEPRPIAEIKPQVPAVLERLVRHCLEKDPAQRFQSARDLGFALETIGGGGPDGTRAAVPGPRRSPVTRLVLATALGLAGLALGVVIFAVARITATPRQPTFKRLTFQRGTVEAARFAPDGSTIVYSAAWDGEAERIYTTRTESPATSPLPLPAARLLDVSARGELAIALYPRNTLARVPLGGGAPREMMDSVIFADWSPDGTELAVVRQMGALYSLEYPVGKPLLRTGYRIRCPRVAPGGNHIAFFENRNPMDSRGAVMIIDRAGRQVARSRVWADGWGLAWSPAGDAVWFTAADSSGPRWLFELIRNGHERVLLRVPGALTLLDTFGDGRVMLARANHAFSSIGLTPGGARERDLSWMEWSVAAGLSPDGRQVLLGEFGEAVGSRYAVGLRGMDGSPVMRLGEGYAGGLSSDGKWAVAGEHLPRPHPVVLPTGPGSVRHLDPGVVTQITWLNWISRTHRILFEGWEGDRGPYCYWQDIGGGAPQRFTPDSVQVFWMPSSPDGQFVIGRTPSGRTLLWPIQGGESRLVRGLGREETPVGWCTDGRSFFVRSGLLPARIERLNPETGRREFVRDLMPSDPAGITLISNTLLTPDGRAYVYVVGRALSDLYLVEGLR